ncbi:MAG: trigger factor family protein [Spirochaetia bacterium]|nr:trigger factor family protein [Spirochaetota bacterium]MCX8096029.1 trigger factor family protein [Spirochaetota bacterium]MDW8111824.1 trigger factor family protein [Spirochaetia bacterium]
MKVESEERELGIFLYNVDLSEDEIREIENKVIDTWRKNANIPGYRKGMVPLEVLKQRYSKEIYRAFEDMLEDRVISEAKKRHPYPVDKAKIIRRYRNKSNSIIKIPGQTENDTVLFTVKVSSQTSLIPKDENELIEKIKNISFVSYSLNAETIDFEELTNLFFSSSRVERHIDDKNLNNYVVEMIVEFEEGSHYVLVILPLELFPETAKHLQSKKISQEIELPIDNKLKNTLQNYYNSIYDEPLKLGNKIKVKLFGIFALDRDRNIIENNVRAFSEDPLTLRNFLSEKLKNKINSFNSSRLINKVVRTVMSNSKIHISETEYLSELLEHISWSLIQYSDLPIHISSLAIDLNSYLPRSLERLIVDNVIKFIYKTFIGNIYKIDKTNDVEVYSKVYQKLLEICNITNKNISYRELKEEFPFLLYEFILDK